MKKIMFASLILVLLGALIMPAIAVSVPVAAWSSHVTCSASALEFRVYVGVPTYLWGFIPLEGGQTLTLTSDQKGFLESAGWTVSDDASWLNEDPVLGVVGCITKSEDVTVRVNTDGLTAGTYTAAITFKFTTCATKTITVPVTVDVIQPQVMGPLCIGVDKALLKNALGKDTFAAENNYTGLTTQLLTNPDNVMDMQAIETTGTWSMLLKGGLVKADGSIDVNTDGSSLTVNGVPDQINYGIIMNLGSLISMMGMSLGGIPADFDWGNNYAAMLATPNGDYLGIVIADINALLPLVSQLGSLLNPPAATETDINAAPADGGSGDGSGGTIEDMVIPLKPIMNLLPTLMPVLSDLLGNATIMAILSPLLGLLPPIAIVMPLDVIGQLAAGLVK